MLEGSVSCRAFFSCKSGEGEASFAKFENYFL